MSIRRQHSPGKSAKKSTLCLITTLLSLIALLSLSGCAERPLRPAERTKFGTAHTLKYNVNLWAPEGESLKDFVIYLPFPAANGSARGNLLNNVLHPSDPLWNHLAKDEGSLNRSIVKTRHGDMLKIEITSFKGATIHGETGFYTLMPRNTSATYPLQPVSGNDNHQTSWIYVDYKGDAEFHIYLTYTAQTHYYYLPSGEPLGGGTVWIVGTSPNPGGELGRNEKDRLFIESKGWIKVPIWGL